MSRTHLALALSVLFLGGGPASAQQPPAAGGPAEAGPDARALAEKGLRHFDLAEYDEAILAYKDAYRLEPAPGLLYNIAQSYRLKGDCARSVTFYKNFLRAEPKSRQRAKVEQWIAEMEACASTQPPVPDVSPPAVVEPGPGPAPGPEPEPGPQPGVGGDAGPSATRPTTPGAGPTGRRDAGPARPGRGLRTAGLVTAGAGIVLTGTAIVFAIDAGGAASDLDGLFEQGGVWDQEHADLEARLDRSNLAAITLGGVGAAALVGGGVLYYLGAKAGRSAPRVTASRRPGGAAVTLGWDF